MEKYLKIPPEIWLKVFENLTVRDLCQVMLVSDLYHIIIYAIYALTGVARLERDWKHPKAVGRCVDHEKKGFLGRISNIVRHSKVQ